MNEIEKARRDIVLACLEAARGGQDQIKQRDIPETTEPGPRVRQPKKYIKLQEKTGISSTDRFVEDILTRIVKEDIDKIRSQSAREK